jgi:hypothetical protein
VDNMRATEAAGTTVLQARVAASPGAERMVVIEIAGYQIPVRQKESSRHETAPPAIPTKPLKAGTGRKPAL